MIFGVACAVRFLEPASLPGYALTGLGFVVLATAGALGGSLAHRHLVGSSEEDVHVAREAADDTRYSRGEVNMLSARRR